MIKIGAAGLINGQTDIIRALFWFQIEASVAVMAVSVTIFRSIFLSEGSKVTQKQVGRQNLPQSIEKAFGPDNQYEYLPSMPDAVYGTTTSIRRASPSEDRPLDRLSVESLDLPFQGSRIKVTHDVALEIEVRFHLL